MKGFWRKGAMTMPAWAVTQTSAARSAPTTRMRARSTDRRGSMGHALMEKRTGLVVGSMLTQLTGTAEREAALALLAGYRGGSCRRITLGADCPKEALSATAYDVTEFVGDLRSRSVTPHIAKNDHLTKTGKRRRSAIDGRTTRHVGYALSQGARKCIEEAFGWIKTVAGHQKTRFQGVGFAFTFAAAVYNLAPLPKLLAGAAPCDSTNELPSRRPVADRRGRSMGSRLP